MERVFVTHPALQHSHQLALALAERGLLQRYCSGIPIIEPGQDRPWWLTQKHIEKLRVVQISKSLRDHPVIFPALTRLGKVFPNPPSRRDYQHRILHLFDKWAALQVEKYKPDVVIAFENSAYRTFQVAKSIGARCILEAPAIEHRAASKLVQNQQTAYLGRINFQKDQEVELADLIVTCSELAADTYLRAGVHSSKLRHCALGADVFPEHKVATNANYPNRPLRFVYAGSMSYHKGVDIIAAAFKTLIEEDLSFELLIIGSPFDKKLLNDLVHLPKVRHIDSLSQRELFQVFAESDCLLLPSRFDSFGMVVVEAMAQGTPVVVSDWVGAKSIIQKFPNSGWIIPPTADALVQIVRQFICSPEKLKATRESAIYAAKQYTWAAYRNRIGTIITEWLRSSNK